MVPGPSVTGSPRPGSVGRRLKGALRAVLWMLRVIRDELLRAVHSAPKILRLRDRDTRRAYVGFLRARFELQDTWVSAEGGLTGRPYRSYQQYIRHQISKPAHADPDDARRFRDRLRTGLKGAGLLEPGLSVLCLGVGGGEEMDAFEGGGRLVIGIELHPNLGGDDYVRADFQRIPFRSSSMDIVYTNSLDHAFDVDLVIGEMRRVLKGGAVAIVDVSLGAREGSPPGVYESVWWDRVDDLLRRFTGFTEVRREAFVTPWNGITVVLRLNRS